MFNKFISLIEDHAERITDEWISEVKKNPCTNGYKSLPEEILHSRIYDVYKRLGTWLQNDESQYKHMAEHFIRLGRERAVEGLKVSEVIFAIILARVVLWKYFISHQFIDSALDLQKALSFYQQVNNFFDKAAYFVSIGFENIDEDEQKSLQDSDFVNKAVKSVTDWFIKY